jgi:CRISPR-associated endoribonuclease Cas6
MKYHYIKIKIQSSDIKVPYFTGAMLRGSLGYALKKVTCINPSYVCDGCFGSDNCLYHKLYELENIHHKYRFDIDLDSNKFDFGLFIYDDMCESLPYFLSALNIALSQNGIGRDRWKFESFKIYVNDSLAYENGKFLPNLNYTPQQITTEPISNNLKITLKTPLRIKKSNTLEYQDIKIEHILRSIHQRKEQIYNNTTTHKLPYKPTYTTFIKLLEYKKIYRKSYKQDKKLVLDGVLGEMVVLGLDEKSLELLQIGKILGIGKQTTFGFGGIEISEIKEN